MRPNRRSNTGRRGRDVTSSLSSNYDSVFLHRKNALYRRAAELTAITDCDIAIVVLSPEGELSQFSTAPMKKILRTYSRLCSLPHEIHTMESIQEKVTSAGGDGVGLTIKKDGSGQNKSLSKQANTTSKKGTKNHKQKTLDDDGEAKNAWETVEAILSMGAGIHRASNEDTDEDNTFTTSEEDGQRGNSVDSRKQKKRVTEITNGNIAHSTKKHRLSKMRRSVIVKSEDVGGTMENGEKEMYRGSSGEGTPEQGDSPTENGRMIRQNMEIGTPLNKKQKPIAPSAEAVSLLGPAVMDKHDSGPSSG